MPASIPAIVSKNLKFEFRSLLKTLAEIVIVFMCYLFAVLHPAPTTVVNDLSAEDLAQLVIYDDGTVNNIDFLQETLLAIGKPKLTTLAHTGGNKEYIILQSSFEDSQRALMDEKKEYYDVQIMMNEFDPIKMLAAVVITAVNNSIFNATIRFPSEFRTIKSDKESEKLWAIRCNGIIAPATKINNTKNNQENLYIREGFLQLQHDQFLKWISKAHSKDTLTLLVNARPFEQYTNWGVCNTKVETNTLMVLYSFSFFLPFLNLLWRYGREREENMLAHHWRYGFEYAQYWMGNCIISYSHLLLLDVIIVILVSLPFDGQFGGSVVGIIPYLMIYNIALLISVIFVVSVSNKAYHAVLFGAVIWLTMFSLFSTLVGQYRHMSPLLFFVFVIFFNNGFAYGMRELQEDDEIVYPLLTMVVCCLFYWILISLAEYFYPGSYIKTLPFNLFCSGRCLTTMNKPLKPPKDKIKNILMLDKPLVWENFEFGNFSSVEMIRLKNIHTKVKSESVRIKNITMRIYSNEITVILGPHCSGKTKIIQILAGWERPILGHVQIDGKDLYEHWNKYRNQIDVCMSNNTLFDLLTAEETLVYYMHLKLPDYDDQIIKMELDKFFTYIKSVRIEREMLVKKLDFSQKRLLSLCCTLSGGTKIILLDEPTLHMKGKYQRLFWRILHKEKNGRAIVMTTFDVTEADAVGDRIAMLGEGALLSFGTQFFLRSKFGIGCDLIIVKSATASTEAITELIERFIPGIMPENEIGELLYYKLPIEMRPKFQNMLIHLEKEQKRLGIIDMRALSSELTEVYMTMGTRNAKQIIIDDKKLHYDLVAPKKLGKQQTRALLNKKLIHQAPNIVPLITIGVSFLFIVLIATMTKHLFNVFPTRYYEMKFGATEELDLKDFKDCQTIYISSVKKSKHYGDNSMTFDENSLQCLSVSYESYIRQSITVKDKYGAVEYNGSNYILWINQHMFHSAPMVLNLMHNWYLSKEITDRRAIALISSSPIRPPLSSKFHLLEQERVHLILPLVLGVAVPISIACFIVPLVEERKYHLLTLQKLAGVSMTRYWVVNFLWDFSTFFSYTIVYTIILALSPIDGYSFSDKLLAMLLMNIYGIAGLGLIYILSLYFYWTMWSAFLIALLVQIVTGIFSYIFYWELFEINDIFFYVWSIFPTFSLMEGISNVYTQTMDELYCEKICKGIPGCNKNDICSSVPGCCLDTIFKFEDPGILLPISYMLASAFIIFCILFIIESIRNRKRFSTKRDVKTLRSATHPYDDRDVMQLKQLVAHQDLQSSLKKRFMVDQLEYKIPKKGETLKTISFVAEEGQCIAIYGSRHSNKTHFAGQIIGQNTFAFGDVFIDGTELKYEPKQAYKKLSYVPQEHGLWGTFTPREILRFFCMLRGIQPKDIRAVLRDLSNSFTMSGYMDKTINTLSVDRRRKVNIALALIAHPTVIVLDEPTRGLEPKTCREIWNVLRYKRFMGKTLIVTTSDAMELEALSDRVLIYDEGEMLAFGNAQYLRGRYTKGFYLHVKLKIDGATAEEAKEKVRIDNCFKFYLPVPMVSYSFLYGSMEKNKRRLNIADYCVSQGTLQDVVNAIEAIRNK